MQNWISALLGSRWLKYWDYFQVLYFELNVKRIRHTLSSHTAEVCHCEKPYSKQKLENKLYILYKPKIYNSNKNLQNPMISRKRKAYIYIEMMKYYFYYDLKTFWLPEEARPKCCRQPLVYLGPWPLRTLKVYTSSLNSAWTQTWRQYCCNIGKIWYPQKALLIPLLLQSAPVNISESSWKTLLCEAY